MNINIFNHIGTTDLLTLMRNLAMTLRAGVPLVRALQLFEQDAPRGGKRKLLAHLRRSVETGHALHEAMGTAPKRFPPLVVSLVKTGEFGGTLEESFGEIVKHLQKSIELKRKIRNAMMYPTFVLVALLGLGLSIGTLVLPELIPLFESLDVELPLMTRMLLWFAAFFDAHSTGVVLSVILTIVVLFVASRLESLRPWLHRLWLLIPYLRVVQKQAAIAQITATLGTLMKSGIPIHEAIPSTAEATGNAVFRAALVRALPVVESGHTFSEGLRTSGRLFPEMATTLIDIGEETGTLTETLEYLAEYYEGEVDYAVKNLMTALEPILLIVIGVLVGGTVLAIITPIYDVTGSIR